MEELSLISDRLPVGCEFAATTTFALPAEDSWKELPNSRPVAVMEASTVFVESGECLLAVSFILSAITSNPVLTERITGGITPERNKRNS